MSPERLDDTAGQEKLAGGELLAEVRDGVGHVLLNRPKALNALTLDQIRALTPLLREWRQNPAVHAVVVSGAGEKAFCAGGDIRSLYDASHGGRDSFITEFFRDEYRLDRLTRVYDKPYVSIIDGIVMGGGVGISVHGRYRVATERTVFAMPETGIGFFPDVGGAFFLPTCPGEVGLYLGLTGARLKAADSLWAGVATHFVPAERLPELEAAIARAAGDDGALARALDRLQADPGPAPLAERRAVIDRCFGADTLAGVLARLEEEGGEWAGRTLETIMSRSPFAQAVTFRQIRNGRTLSFDDALKMEYRLSQRLARGHDFTEGVRATIIDKDGAPRWRPATLDAVTEEMVDAAFAPLEGIAELTFEED